MWARQQCPTAFYASAFKHSLMITVSKAREMESYMDLFTVIPDFDDF